MLHIIRSPITTCTLPVPSDQDGHDHAPVAQNGEQDDDGEVDDPALLAFLHAGALPLQLSEREDITGGRGSTIEKGLAKSSTNKHTY